MRLAAEWSVIESLSVSALKQSHQPVAIVRITPTYRERIDAGTNVVKSAGSMDSSERAPCARRLWNQWKR
jgi:hypothetical protein